MSNKDHYIIDSLQQIKAVSSPVRQEIIDVIIAKRECSITDIAIELGRPADGLYYHIKALIKEKLLIATGINKNNPRQESMYSLANEASIIEVKYNQTDSEKIKAINKMVKSMLKISLKDFENGLTLSDAKLDGDLRNIWAARFKSRLNEGQVKRLNYHLHELESIFKEKNNAILADDLNENLYSLQWVLAPVEAQPKRRK